ncbi:MAG: hypothetical protein HYV27_21425 [Candidatus Hydrogenedentes bacterium]|nr:hypothetical protein [Candidatus Hydrogenedentota bacterium]
MICVEKVSEPEQFDVEVRKKGGVWLADHPTGRVPPYWRPFLPALSKGFKQLCGYSAMYTPSGTVDHYVDIKERRELAYEWDNYRFASELLNSMKGCKGKDGSKVFDPYEVNDGWFEIILPSLQLIVTDSVPPELREQAMYTLERLHLRDDERIIRQRRHWIEEYKNSGDIGVLERNAPLLARAVTKRLLAGQPIV